MANLILLNKPFNVLCQFTDNSGRDTLANYIKTPGVYPAGRLDYDSEGLLLLTDSGTLQSRIADPQHKMKKTYWVQVEGHPKEDTLQSLREGVVLKDGPTRPAKVAIIDEPELWERNPPIRKRANDVTTWLQIEISEGRNRQVRRMTAHIGHPTLRLIRYAIGPWNVSEIQTPGKSISTTVNMPADNQQATKQPHKNTRNTKSHKTRSNRNNRKSSSSSPSTPSKSAASRKQRRR